MDSQLRTRLIGAAVLIGLAVIFLPMVLDKNTSQTPAPNEEISLDIPAVGSDVDGLQTRTLPINDQAPMVEIDATAPDPVANVDTSRANPTVARLASETDPRMTPQSSEGMIQRDAPIPTSIATTTAPVIAAPVVAAPPPAVKPPVAVKPLVATKPVAALAPPATGGRFGVNFGSYGALENAERLITQLAAVKVKASVEPVVVGSKSLFRVVSRNYPSRGAAEAARLAATTSIDGLNASVMQGEIANQTAPATAVASALQGFAVQIGVYGDKGKADELIAQLKAKGFAAFSERVITPSGSTLRVRVGPIIKRPDADKMKADIKAKLGFDGIVVPYP